MARYININGHTFERTTMAYVDFDAVVAGYLAGEVCPVGVSPPLRRKILKSAGVPDGTHGGYRYRKPARNVLRTPEEVQRILKETAPSGPKRKRQGKPPVLGYVVLGDSLPMRVIPPGPCTVMVNNYRHGVLHPVQHPSREHATAFRELATAESAIKRTQKWHREKGSEPARSYTVMPIRASLSPQ